MLNMVIDTEDIKTGFEAASIQASNQRFTANGGDSGVTSLPPVTPSKQRASVGGIGTLEMLDLIKTLEASEITCCMVGVGALRYYGAQRVLHAWEVCVPSDQLDEAVRLLQQPPYDQIYESRGPDVVQNFSVHHTLPFYTLKDVRLDFYLVPSDVCHLECTAANMGQSSSGMPYPKLPVLVQSLLDTRDMVALADLIDGMDLDLAWGSSNADLSGTNDVAWSKRRNETIRATAPDYLGFSEVQQSTRALWERLVNLKHARIGLEYLPEVMATRFRVAGSEDPRSRARPWA